MASWYASITSLYSPRVHFCSVRFEGFVVLILRRRCYRLVPGLVRVCSSSILFDVSLVPYWRSRSLFILVMTNATWKPVINNRLLFTHSLGCLFLGTINKWVAYHCLGVPITPGVFCRGPTCGHSSTLPWAWALNRYLTAGQAATLFWHRAHRPYTALFTSCVLPLYYCCYHY